MARASQSYMAAFDERCAALNSGALPPMGAAGAAEKTLMDLLGTAGNLYLGLNNSVTSRYGISPDPVAKAVVEAWKEAWKKAGKEAGKKAGKEAGKGSDGASA
jgi:hypothetical protein